jgi:hypothetical protein
MLGDHVADHCGAFSAIELAAMVRLDGIRAARARFHGFADGPAIDSVAHADDHENYLQQLRMIVNFTFRARQPPEAGPHAATALASRTG